MSRLLARIMLALLMLPLGTVVYVATFVLLMEFVFRFSRQSAAFLVTGIVCWSFVGVYWILLWRGTVTWTKRRVCWTIGAAVASFVLGLLVAGAANAIEEGFGTFLGTLVTILSWLAFSVFVWRETADEHAARIRGSGDGNIIVCPRCGYNMTGLERATCPECGAVYTISELVATQPGSAASELE